MFTPGGAPGVARCRVARTSACARARVAVVREMERGRGERARSLARSPGPVRGPVRPPSAARGGRRALLPLSLSSVHSRCRLTRAAAAPGCPSFPSGSSVPFRVSRGWCASVPRSGEGERPASASRRPPAVAPGRLCRTEPASREGARPGVSRRGGGPPFRVSAPDPCPGT